MKIFLEFLESSSIGGLPQIERSKTWVEKIYWIAVVTASWVLAGYFCAEAFADWKKYPIKTTTEIFPIYGVQFPKIVVCPPKVEFGFYCINL